MQASCNVCVALIVCVPIIDALHYSSLSTFKHWLLYASISCSFYLYIQPIQSLISQCLTWYSPKHTACSLLDISLLCTPYLSQPLPTAASISESKDGCSIASAATVATAFFTELPDNESFLLSVLLSLPLSFFFLIQLFFFFLFMLPFMLLQFWDALRQFIFWHIYSLQWQVHFLGLKWTK